MSSPTEPTPQQIKLAILNSLKEKRHGDYKYNIIGREYAPIGSIESKFGIRFNDEQRHLASKCFDELRSAELTRSTHSSNRDPDNWVEITDAGRAALKTGLIEPESGPNASPAFAKDLVADQDIITNQATTSSDPQRKPRKDYWLKIISLIIFAVTLLILLLTPSRVILAGLLIGLCILFLTADLRGWVSEKVPHALDRIGTIVSLILAIVLLVFPSEKPSEPNDNSARTQPPAVTPTLPPIATSTPNPTRPANVNSIKQQDGDNELNPQTTLISSEWTESFFNNDISIAVNGILFGGEPLHHTVNATIRSPGHKPLKVTNFEVNAVVTYKGKAIYEISLIEVDTFWAKFEVRKIETKIKAH